MRQTILIFSTLVTTLLNAQVPTNGLVGYWPFNGNAYDESYNGLHGTKENVIDTVNRFNLPSSAYYFNGVDSRIIVKDTSILDFGWSPLTISAWVKPLSKPITHHHAAIVGKGGYDINNGYELLINSDLKLEWTISQSTLTSTVSLLLNTYTHVVATFDDNANVFKLYINGVERNSSETFASTGPGVSPLSIGRRNDGNNYIASFHGFLDDICIYNRALSASEINDLYLYQEKIHYTTITVTDTLIINANMSSLNPLTYNNVIKVYPNPTNDKIIIDCGQNFNSLNDYKIKIYNNLGQVIYESSITQQSVELSLKNWTGKGLYFINLMKGQEIVDLRKLILQ